jgi:hypothetical protein
LNRLGETGAWDPDALRLEFEELTVLGVDLVETGFETAEIDGLMLLDDNEDLATSEARRHRGSRRRSPIRATSGSSGTIDSHMATPAILRSTPGQCPPTNWRSSC